MKVSDLKEKCVIFKLIGQRNTIKELNSSITIKPMSIFELIKIIASEGVIYGKFGQVYHDQFPIEEIFGYKRLFLFAYYTPYVDLKYSFIAAKNLYDACRLFIKWTNISVVDVNIVCEVMLDDGKINFTTAPYVSSTKYVDFELIGGNEKMMGKPLRYKFIAQEVTISYLSTHIIIHGFIDNTGICRSVPRLLEIIDNDEYKDKDVFLADVSDICTGIGDTTCVIADNIEDTVSDLTKRGNFVSRYWKINIVNVMKGE